jgi:hypothetical protein
MPTNWAVEMGSNETLHFSATIFDLENDTMTFDFDLDSIGHFSEVSSSK